MQTHLSACLLAVLAAGCASPHPRFDGAIETPLSAVIPAPEGAVRRGVDSDPPDQTAATMALLTDEPAALAPEAVSASEPTGFPDPHVPATDLQGGHLETRIPAYPGILNVTAGARFFQDPVLGDLDDQLALGIDYTIKKRDSMIGFNFGVSGSTIRQSSGGVNLQAWMVEASLGPRAFVRIPNSIFYLYGGVAGTLAYAEVERINLGTNSETTFGGTANAGFMVELNRLQALGFEWRALYGTDFDVGNLRGDLDYQQVAMVFSAAF